MSSIPALPPISACWSERRTHPASLIEPLRRKVRERSAEVPVKFTTMEASLSENVATPRFRTLLLGIFAALAVVLAMAGVYGVTAYAVSQRANEVGLRMALGAQSSDVLKMMLGFGLKLAAIGIVAGLAGAVAATRFLTSMLFEVKATDPFTYLAVALLLGVVALGASYIPARRGQPKWTLSSRCARNDRFKFRENLRGSAHSPHRDVPVGRLDGWMPDDGASGLREFPVHQACSQFSASRGFEDD